MPGTEPNPHTLAEQTYNIADVHAGQQDPQLQCKLMY